MVKLNCFILRTTTVVSLGVPTFRVFTVTIELTDCCIKSATGSRCVYHSELNLKGLV